MPQESETENPIVFKSSDSSHPLISVSNGLHQVSVDDGDPGGLKMNSNKTSSKKSNQGNVSIWDKPSKAVCKTHLLCESGSLCEKLLPWYHFENNAMLSSLFDKHAKRTNKMGNNITDYFRIFHERKICDVQTAVQHSFSGMIKQILKQQQAVQNLMLACIHIRHQDQSLSSLESLCMDHVPL